MKKSDADSVSHPSFGCEAGNRVFPSEPENVGSCICTKPGTADSSWSPSTLYPPPPLELAGTWLEEEHEEEEEAGTSLAGSSRLVELQQIFEGREDEPVWSESVRSFQSGARILPAALRRRPLN